MLLVKNGGMRSDVLVSFVERAPSLPLQPSPWAVDGGALYPFLSLAPLSEVWAGLNVGWCMMHLWVGWEAGLRWALCQSPLVVWVADVQRNGLLSCDHDVCPPPSKAARAEDSFPYSVRSCLLCSQTRPPLPRQEGSFRARLARQTGFAPCASLVAAHLLRMLPSVLNVRPVLLPCASLSQSSLALR